MPEFTDLQLELFEIVKKNLKKEGLFSSATCTLKNHEFYSRMKIKPTNEAYITRLLLSLEKKRKIKIERRFLGKGITRMISIL